MAELSRLLDSLPSSSNKAEVLHAVTTLLSGTPLSVLRELIPSVSLNVIFECFDTDNEEELTLCAEVLDKLGDALSALALLEIYELEIITSLGHPHLSIKRLGLKQVSRACEESVQEVIASHGLIIVTLAALVSDPELEIAKKATQALLLVGATQEGLDELLHGNASDSLHSAIHGSDSTIKFRVYEANLTAVASRGLLVPILAELQSDDILGQLNCLELLASLAATCHGLEHLQSSGTVEQVQQFLDNTDSNPLMGLLMPGIIKFLGQIAAHNPEKIETDYQRLINIVFSILEGGDLTLVGIAVETLAFIGTKVAGKLALGKQGNRVTSAFRVLGQLISHSTPLVQTKVLDAVSSMIYIKVEEQTAQLLLLVQTWFSNLSRSTSDAINLIKKAASNPDLPIRLAALNVFSSMAVLPWAQTILNSHPGFNEYLLDRSTENTKEGKEAKYVIVKTLAEAPTTTEIFGRVYLVRLKEYVNEGPFYVRVESSVAFESTD